jgi:hypothetical protein
MEAFDSKSGEIKLIIMIISIWLMVSAFIIGNNLFTRVNSIIIGVIYIILSFKLQCWQKWLIMISGIMLLGVTFFPFYYTTYTIVVSGSPDTQISKSVALTWNIIIGIIDLVILFIPLKIEE